ncbi:hypothetical protein [Ligilactobacillus hayakitensis]|nr:hypothetical protein [Ligilactobacillus hayakitensis]
MAQKLSKEQRKAMARKAMEARAKNPSRPHVSGFAKIDADAKSLRD